jgi:hypothetical protein
MMIMSSLTCFYMIHHEISVSRMYNRLYIREKLRSSGMGGVVATLRSASTSNGVV